MSNQLKPPRWDIKAIIAVIITLCFIIILTLYYWLLGLMGLIIAGAIVALLKLQDLKQKKEVEDYISTLSHRVKKVGEEALLEMPIGIILYSENYDIEWVNHYVMSLTEEESIISHSLNTISETLIPILKGETDQRVISIKKRRYKVITRPEERLLYLSDVTEINIVKDRYVNEKTVLGIIYLDNYEEITQGMDDQIKSSINNEVTNLIKQWGTDHGIYLKRFSSEKFMAVFSQRILSELEKNRFDVLDKVREIKTNATIPLTLSIGVGKDSTDLPELGQMAQSALDLALGRGGDQVAIKKPSGKVEFYGGKSNPVEKRTRVRARVISQALSELIRESDQVFVMGHKNPDMDAIGAAIGIMKMAEGNGKLSRVVIEPDNYGPGVIRLMDAIQENEELWAKFISNDDAVEFVTTNSLVVVVDTHKPSMTMEPRLLNKTDRVVVIDHHRRGEDFIHDPVLVYMEPYASSTAELVTELLEYQPNSGPLKVLEATAMLAGITVDTKSFALRTGSRTFDAASYLRSHGADTILVQRLLREDLDQFNRRTALIRKTEMYRDHIAIVIGDEEDVFDQVVMAQAADTLLSMNDVKASFVAAPRLDGYIGISARSLGDINVQVIMEALEGGGHLTNAATQLKVPLKEVELKLKAAIDDYLEGGETE
ncbi:c-di-AMP phosphodiesterase-like protein [Pullulanibacillus pueri]|uniref:Cyclic-di-AMP phosphodiesterase n=1 Tax=Pullulanibacillus pueri TaxID=1437324 RepID=A0A8J3ELT4_9BACL|nr:DHH family phosphoesterase [Pullulanibacillus pueri]MBM7682187.1 c-di-AMP phosphodiesterase-like protein [Pullulanibacillus pueri]GGH80374.1 cyclic-di-AMP phosphodiesterase GdpP [Pullulanibacillus pueri]